MTAPPLSSQPAAVPCRPYQTFSGGGDHSYYHRPPGPPGPPGLHLIQPLYHGYHGGPPGTSYPYEEHQKHTVFVVEQNPGGGAKESCLSACLAALCCCCLWDTLTYNL